MGSGIVRDARGRFGTGNVPPANCHKRLNPARHIEVRRIILDSFYLVDGPAMLVKLAKEDPVEYFKLIAKIMPREILLEENGTHSFRVVMKVEQRPDLKEDGTIDANKSDVDPGSQVS